PAVGRRSEQPLVELGQPRHVLREECDLGDPGHVGTIRQVLSPAVENLVAQLSRLPGVGSRTAHRLAFHLLQRPKDEARALESAIEDVKERVRFCKECGNLTEEEVCAICLYAR